MLSVWAISVCSLVVSMESAIQVAIEAGFGILADFQHRCTRQRTFEDFLSLDRPPDMTEERMDIYYKLEKSSLLLAPLLFMEVILSF